jgi:hypothetical protein
MRLFAIALAFGCFASLAQSLRLRPTSIRATTKHLSAAGLLLLSTTFFSSPSHADVLDVLQAASRNSEITYSANAKNFARLGSGDASAGSKFASKSPKAAMRRAVQGCKSGEPIRREAGEENEKACITRLLDNGGDAAFQQKVLEVMRARECATCPNGFRAT